MTIGGSFACLHALLYKSRQAAEDQHTDLSDSAAVRGSGRSSLGTKPCPLSCSLTDMDTGTCLPKTRQMQDAASFYLYICDSFSVVLCVMHIHNFLSRRAKSYICMSFQDELT